MQRRLGLLTAVAVVALTGCAVGVQQAMILPWMHGNWMYTGTNFVARDTTGAIMPINIAGDYGQVQDIGTVTQILLAMDLPFMRLSMAPALLGNNNLEFIQADMLYKHLILDEPGRRWWLLGGIAGLILNTGVSYTVHPSQNTTLNGRPVTPDDAIAYQARHDISGLYAAVGAQVELTGWCHGYGELLVRLSRSDTQYESIQLAAGSNGGALDLTNSTSTVRIDRQQQASVTTNYDVPALLVAIGVHFNLPSYHLTRRLIGWHAGDPEMDDARPEPEPMPDPEVPLLQALSPAQAVSPTVP